jgi:sec-independent protein translocase protein TatC
MSPAKRRRPSNFERASEGSMTLIEHIRELRTRLFKACLGITVGAIAGFLVSTELQQFITAPYCEFYQAQTGQTLSCGFNATSVLDPFLLKLKISLYAGLVLAAPIWLYQLWAFIAPGLHKRERRYGYLFAAIATPLFASGFVLGFYLVSRSIPFFLGLNPDITMTANLDGYFEFVTGVMLLFGLGFEIPLVLLLLNIAGVVSARRLLSWWRIAIFLFFLFAAIVTPTPDPFNMTVLAVCMSVLYFAAVGVAFIIDARRGRRQPYSSLDDDEASPIEPMSPVDAPRWGSEYDDRSR